MTRRGSAEGFHSLSICKRITATSPSTTPTQNVRLDAKEKIGNEEEC